MSQDKTKSKYEQARAAWAQFGNAVSDAVVEELMYEATRNVVVPGDPLSSGQLIGRRDLAIELLNKMGVIQ